ncbi:serine/threonine-protein phosphatase 4 regulatory subunit 1 [Camelus ferus]|nr:serine/threonine-protein phosphatase 4 regulatory subunit 1 [Camelus ferus]
MSLIVGVDACSSESDVVVVPSALDFVSQDEMLTPLGRLDKYAASDNVFNSWPDAIVEETWVLLTAPRLLLLDLCSVTAPCSERSLPGPNLHRLECLMPLTLVFLLRGLGAFVLCASSSLTGKPTVRAELMEQVPHIALFCQENRPAIPYAFSKYLLPIVVRYLADQNNQVRKTSQAALLALLEQELIERFDVETKVCPVLVGLTAPDSTDDVKTEAVAIMCRMAPMVGKDITERLILPRFCEMCCDCRMFHVRKVCAANFGDICSVVGQQATEEMLPTQPETVQGLGLAVLRECQCVSVSGQTGSSIWEEVLGFCVLAVTGTGTLICPSLIFFSNSFYNFHFLFPKQNNERTRDQEAPEDVQIRPEDAPAEPAAGPPRVELEGTLKDGTENPRRPPGEAAALVGSSVLCAWSSEPPQEAAGDEKDRKPGHGRSASRLEEPGLLDQEYNSFHFWRTPLPEIDLDMELGQGSGSPLGPEGPGAAPQVSVPGSASLTMATRKELEELIENLEPHVDDPDVRAQVDVLAAALRASSLDACDEPGEAARRSPVQDEPAAGELPGCGLSHEASVPLISDAVEDVDSALCYMRHDPDLGSDGGFSPDEERRPRVQDVVPQALLDQYLSMTDPSRAQTVDTEIAKHCAYSLPGVALTLGRQNWHCLRETYETLASDMQVGGQARGTYETLASDMQVGGQARGTYETLASDMQVGGQARGTYETLASDMQVGGQARGTYETLASDMQVGGQARGTYETLASDMQVGGQARGTYETLASDMQVGGQARGTYETLASDMQVGGQARGTYETLASDMQVGGQARGTYETLASDMQVGGQARGTYETLASDMQVGGQARGTYKTLASDMQWKVRRTLAFSIHELAVILGDQLTAADLVPIFNGFLKDLDEVRIGVLKHLHDFLKLLHVDKRREYLYQLQEFLVTDNSRNWRFRAELAEQLILLLELYSPRDVYDYLRPIALSLCADKVSSVRWISYKLVSEMVRKLHRAAPPSFGVDLIHELVENFGRCPRWSGRQAFVFVCQTVIEDDCLPMDQFALHLMPHLLTLANDRVPNVRVLLAKTLRQTLLEKEYFSASASCHQEAVEQTIVALQMDRDSDVKSPMVFQRTLGQDAGSPVLPRVLQNWGVA